MSLLVTFFAKHRTWAFLHKLRIVFQRTWLSAQLPVTSMETNLLMTNSHLHGRKVLKWNLSSFACAINGRPILSGWTGQYVLLWVRFFPSIDHTTSKLLIFDDNDAPYEYIAFTNEFNTENSFWFIAYLGICSAIRRNRSNISTL